jgi:hypothetical protein
MIKSDRFDRCFLISLVGLQVLLASAFYFRELAWYPAPCWDQSVFLEAAYHLEERVFTHSPLELLRALWTHDNVNGLLLPIEGALSGIVLGGARFPQLAVNFVFFLVLQLFAFETGKEVFGRRAYGYMLLGLILGEASPWYWSGGLFDFRQDFSAYCLYGIWGCAVLRSRTFTNRRWSLGAGAIAGVLVLHRFLTIVYLTAVFFGLIAVLAGLGLPWCRKSEFASATRNRLGNSVLAMLILFLVSLPFLVRNWAGIYDYYVVGHVLSGEKNVRAAAVGVFNLGDNLWYYPHSLLFDHLGPTFLWAAFIAIVIPSLALALQKLGKGPGGITRLAVEPFYGACFLILAILVPIAVLTFDTAKSACVVSIVGVPVALLMVTCASSLGSQLSHNLKSGLISVSAVVVMLLGLYNELFFLTRHLPNYAQREDLKRFGELDKWLANYAIKRNWRHPKISFDVISDLLQSDIIISSGYEQTRELVDFQTLLGSGIMSVNRDEVFSSLADSDLVVLTTKEKSGVYPFWESIRQLWPEMRSWCDINMDVAMTETFSDFTATVYVRRGP